MIFLEPLKKYAVFSGVATRKEYWMFVLFNIVVWIVAATIDAMTGTYNLQMGYGLISGIASLALLLPNLALTVRRLHDTNRSAWMLLLFLIPIVNIWLICVIAFFSSRSDSRFRSGDVIQGSSFLD